MPCLDENSILRLARGDPDPSALVEERRHAESCEACRTLVAFARAGASQIDTPVAGSAEQQLAHGGRIGRYLLLERLGAGGMGVVWLAYDPEIDRRIALKLIRTEGSAPGLHLELQQRLLREARAMARPSHPEVIAIHDAGTVGDQVFIAMEYVEGGTLRGWLAQAPRPWREVVAIFARVGRGLSAAHAAGLVHRDFKPDNVLVGKDGRVRVTDFGLARLLDAAPDAAANGTSSGGSALAVGSAPAHGHLAVDRLTRTGAFIGSPAYTAPEQMEGKPADARADVFSFCVALYEALYGARPFAGRTVYELHASIAAGHVEPAPKGTKVPSWLRKILLRGLQENLEDRYPSMDALLAALAKDPALIVRRAALGAGGIAIVALLALGLRAQQRQQSMICKGAEARLAGVWDEVRKGQVRAAFAAAAPTTTSAATAVAISLDAYAAGWSRMSIEACEATRLRGEQSEDLLDLRMQCLAERRRELSAATDLLARADAQVVERSARLASALTPLEGCANAAALRSPSRIPGDPAVRAVVDEVRTALARAKALFSAGKYPDGLALAKGAAARVATLGYKPVQAEAFLQLGVLETMTGAREPAARSLLNAAVAAEASGADNVAAEAHAELAHVAGVLLERREAGREHARHAAAFLERAGGNDKLSAYLTRSIGWLALADGKQAEALAAFEQVVAMNEKLYGHDSAAVGTALNDLGLALRGAGRLEDAVLRHREALAVFEKVGGKEHTNVAVALDNLASDFSMQGVNLEEAEAALARSVAIRKTALGAEHPAVGLALNNLGGLKNRRGRTAEARKDLEAALAIKRKAGPNGRGSVAYTLAGLADGYLIEGRTVEAIRAFEEALAIRQALLPAGHPLVAETLAALGQALLDRGDGAAASKLLDQALAMSEKALGPDHPQTAQTLALLGAARLGQRKAALALPLLERAAALEVKHKVDALELSRTRFSLARALWDTGGDRGRAKALAALAYEGNVTAGPAAKRELAAVDSWLQARR